MENRSDIAKLENVGLREIWPDEARDLTPWLASEDGLGRLGEILGFHLECIGMEESVGPFFADILAKVATEDDHKVIIENQLGKTNHDHLGKAITYSAGLGAKTVVWVAPHFTEEHRQALDWLNENTVERVSFWGLEIHAFRIDGSRPAPQFVIISSPNITTKKAREIVQAVEKKTIDEMMALAAKRQVDELTKIILTLAAPDNEYVWAIPSRAFGGSFRCFRKALEGAGRMILGINVSGERRQSPLGRLDIWVPVPSMAAVAGTSVSDVESILEPLPVFQKGYDWILRLESENEAHRVVETLSRFFELHPGFYGEDAK